MCTCDGWNCPACLPFGDSRQPAGMGNWGPLWSFVWQGRSQSSCRPSLCLLVFICPANRFKDLGEDDSEDDEEEKKMAMDSWLALQGMLLVNL